MQVDGRVQRPDGGHKPQNGSWKSSRPPVTGNARDGRTQEAPGRKGRGASRHLRRESSRQGTASQGPGGTGGTAGNGARGQLARGQPRIPASHSRSLQSSRRRKKPETPESVDGASPSFWSHRQPASRKAARTGNSPQHRRLAPLETTRPGHEWAAPAAGVPTKLRAPSSDFYTTHQKSTHRTPPRWESVNASR